jgi:translation elongation factor EF-4
MHTEHVATGMGKLLVLHTAWAMTESKWQAFHAAIAAMRATIMIAKRKAKTLRKQVHKQVRVCGGGQISKERRPRENQKKEATRSKKTARRWELRKRS